MIPPYGVYASRVCIDGVHYNGISNLGQKPTIEGEHQVGLETHILDFAGDLYGRELQVELLFYIRSEERFSDIEALKMQIQNDIETMKHEML